MTCASFGHPMTDFLKLLPVSIAALTKLRHRRRWHLAGEVRVRHCPARQSSCSERPMVARISLISFSDLRPKFLVLSISASVFWTSSPML